MRSTSPADQYLARLLRRPSYRLTIYTLLIVNATASLYLKLIAGRVDSRPPSYLGLFCLYGFLMALIARDSRSRVAYTAFGALIAVTFSRGLLSAGPAVAGLLEVTSSLILLAALMSLARDPDFVSVTPVLQSGSINPAQTLEDSNAQARADSPSGRGDRHEPRPGQGQG